MRLIDAEQIGLTDMEIIMCDGNYKKALEMLIDKIANAPTIEPQRMRGRWIKLYEGNYKCSECGDWWGNDDNDMVENFRFCPNCGADMRGDSNG